MMFRLLIRLFLAGAPLLLFSQTIEEKELLAKSDGVLLDDFDASDRLAALNEQLRELKGQLQEKYASVSRLDKESEEEACSLLLKEVNRLRVEIRQKEMQWHQVATDGSGKNDEVYAFWDQDETTLSQLVMEFGSSDYLYIIPPEIFNMKLNLHSGVPIPRESWSELIEIILSQNGVGVRELNPYVRQLFLLKQDLIAVSSIVNKRSDLELVPSHSRIIYIFSPGAESARNVSYFFERFRDPRKTYIHQIGYKIAIVAAKEEVEKLISLYDAVWEKESEKITKVAPLSKISPTEMEKILKAYFGDLGDRGRIGMMRGSDDLNLFALNQENAIVLVGMKDVVKRAEKIIKETETQISDPCEMTVFWYTCRHSDPIDLCDVLEKVYQSLVCSKMEGSEGAGDGSKPPIDQDVSIKVSPPAYYGPTPPPTPHVVQPPVAVAATAKSQKQKSTTMNFIPYPKNGSIMMVVRRDTLEKIKELLRKLDVPKKMVQIEVLLFEKKITNRNNFGLNLLKMGAAAKDVKSTGLSFDSNPGPTKGILNFFLSRPKMKHFPAFDIAYNFLMSQEDVRINASPSVTTVNQTPAQVSIVEEISINNGAAPIDNNSNITFEKSYTRAQYGVTLVMTPTIHEPDPLDKDERRFITLETNVTFDTINSDVNDRPKVNRRHVENLVRVLDGETVILGGLRRKTGEDNTEKIPFLGEIPGIAKLFGTSRLTDELTEMIIFITPTVIFDSKSEMIRVRTEELKKRPGDLPEFLQRVVDARENKKRKLFENSFKLMFGNNDNFFTN